MGASSSGIPGFVRVDFPSSSAWYNADGSGADQQTVTCPGGKALISGGVRAEDDDDTIEEYYPTGWNGSYYTQFVGGIGDLDPSIFGDGSNNYRITLICGTP